MTPSSGDLEVIRNRTFDEIAVGDRASIERTLTAADIATRELRRNAIAATRSRVPAGSET